MAAHLPTDEPHIEWDHDDASWQKFKRYGILILILLALIAVGFGGWQVIENQQKETAAQLLAQASTEEEWQQVITRFPGSAAAAQALLRLASEAQAKADYAQAIAFYDQFLKDFPQHPTREAAAFARANCLALTHRTDEALLAFRSIAEGPPTAGFVIPASIEASRILRRKGDLDAARSILNRAATLSTQAFHRQKIQEELTLIEKAIANIASEPESGKGPNP